MTITTNTNSTVKELKGDIILVEHLENDKMYGSIYLPQSARPTHTAIRAQVLLVGSKFPHKDDVKVGSIVLVSKYLGTIIDKTKEHIRIYDSEDVLGVVE
jgi:co-chaperonin GroES (HSP10)